MAISPTRTFFRLLLLFLLVSASIPPAARPQANAVTVYRGATLIDGVHPQPQTGISIVVRGERIESIQPASTPAPAGSSVVDVSGLFVLPGLINTHIHIATDTTREQALALMRRDLYCGITAERDMAGDTRQLAELARVSLLGEVPGPDIYYAALMAGPSFFADPRTHAAARGAVAGDVPWMKAVTADTKLQIAVAEARGTGATAIKIYADLSAELVTQITREAHRQGMLVWAHATIFPASAIQVVDAGVDSVSHAAMLAIAHPPATYAASHKHPAAEEMYAGGLGAPLQAVVAEMKRHNTILDATLIVYRPEGATPKPAQPNAVDTLDIAARATHAAYEAGVAISSGTDTDDEDNKEWSPLRDELLLLQDKAGMSPADVLRSATVVGARVLGQEGDIGAAEPGKLANLVFLAKNPLDGAEAFRTVVLTVKRGKPYWRRDFSPANPSHPASK